MLNVGESDIRNEEGLLSKYRPLIEGRGVELAAACASIEMEIAQLDGASAREFMDDLGIQSSALDRLLRASYHLLGLISFFTVGHDECRAWMVRRGVSAKEAAGAVHSDMERGFIRADVVHYEDFIARGSLVQFDRGDIGALDAYVAGHAGGFAGVEGAVEDLKAADAAYRDSLPDVTHHHINLLVRPRLWTAIHRAWVRGWEIRRMAEGKS